MLSLVTLSGCGSGTITKQSVLYGSAHDISITEIAADSGKKFNVNIDVVAAVFKNMEKDAEVGKCIQKRERFTVTLDQKNNIIEDIEVSIIKEQELIKEQEQVEEKTVSLLEEANTNKRRVEFKKYDVVNNKGFRLNVAIEKISEKSFKKSSESSKIESLEIKFSSALVKGNRVAKLTKSEKLIGTDFNSYIISVSEDEGLHYKLKLDSNKALPDDEIVTKIIKYNNEYEEYKDILTELKNKETFVEVDNTYVTEITENTSENSTPESASAISEINPPAGRHENN